MLRIDQVTIVDWDPNKYLGLGRYVVNAKHETHQEDGSVDIQSKQYFQGDLLKKDLKRNAFKVIIPMVIAMALIFGKKDIIPAIMLNAISLDSTTDPGVNQLTWSHTVGTGGNPTLVVPSGGIINLTGDITGTYNSVAMTKSASVKSAGGETAVLTLINPATGTHSVTYNSFGNQRNGGASISFLGSDQGTIGGTAVNHNDSASSLSMSLTVQRAGSYTIEAWGNYSATSVNSAANSQTRFANQSTTNLGWAAGYKLQAATGAQTLGFTSNNSGVLGIAGVEVMQFQSPRGAFFMEMLN